MRRWQLRYRYAFYFKLEFEMERAMTLQELINNKEEYLQPEPPERAKYKGFWKPKDEIQILWGTEALRAIDLEYGGTMRRIRVNRSLVNPIFRNGNKDDLIYIVNDFSPAPVKEKVPEKLKEEPKEEPKAKPVEKSKDDTHGATNSIPRGERKSRPVSGIGNVK